MLKPATKRLLNQLKSDLIDFNDSEQEHSSEVDIYVGYKRPEIVNNLNVNEDYDLSEYVRFRLFLARYLALKRYKEIWG